LVHAKRFLPEVNFILGVQIGKFDPNAAHPIRRLCGVFENQNRDDRVSVPAVETSNLLRPCNVCGGLMCEGL
jgi:hypothetical protein